MNQCPQGHPASPGATHCPECGTSIKLAVVLDDESATRTTAPPPPSAGGSHVCPEGHLAPAGAKFCQACGAAIGSEPPLPGTLSGAAPARGAGAAGATGAAAAPVASKAVWIVAIVGVVAAVGLGGYVLATRSDGSTPTSATTSSDGADPPSLDGAVPTVSTSEQLVTEILGPVLGCTDFEQGESENSNRDLGLCTMDGGQLRMYVYPSEEFRSSLADDPEDDNQAHSGRMEGCEAQSPDEVPVDLEFPTVAYDNWVVEEFDFEGDWNAVAVELASAVDGTLIPCE